MIAIRKIQDVKSGVVTIDLPPNFHAERVEIIILPVEESPDEESSQRESNLQKLLLNAPTLTEEELQEFESVREWMNQWNVKEF
jgi:hypothetical protein